RQELRADLHPLVEQSFNRNSAHDCSQRKLGSVVEVALPVLRFVRSLGRLGYLVSDQHAEFKTDVVGGEDFLARHEQRRLAEICHAEREVATPTDVSARAENLDEFAFVI